MRDGPRRCAYASPTATAMRGRSTTLAVMMTFLRRAPLVLASLVACGPDDDGGASEAATAVASTTTTASGTSGTSPATEGSETASSGATAEAPTTGGEAALTYYRDIKQILDRKCASCHRPGDIGPFAITTYAETQLMAPVIAASVEAGTMPPWSPSAECNTYKHDRSLAADERGAILDWVAAGAPEGDPADEPPPIDDPEPEVDFDIALGISEPFTPTVSPDEYRCFLLDWPKDQDSYATAFSVTPGERSIVHHVIAFIIPPQEVAAFDALDAADPGPGYPCYGGPGGEASIKAQWLGAWVPGSGGSGALPEGTGILVKPGSKIAMQMHYHPLPGALPDQSQLKVRTAATVERPAYLLPLTNPGWLLDSPPMTIPAGAPDTVHSFEIDLGSAIYYLFPGSPFGIGKPVVAHAAGVHMHTIGARASLTINHGDSSECLIDVPRWDFNWQGTYDLSGSTVVEPTDKVRLECHFDNSAGDQPLKWGEGTGDEMCLGIVYVSAP
jgi:hypothetical protein